MLYSKYPKILYAVKINDDIVYKPLVDITTNIRLTSETINNVVNYDYRMCNDGDTPEILSDLVYNTPSNHHLVMLANDKFDWREDNPVRPTVFDSYISEKYAHPFDVHHYEDVNGNEVDSIHKGSDDPDDMSPPKNVIPVTNYEYEMRKNESKRPVKLIKAEYTERINDMIKDYLTK